MSSTPQARRELPLSLATLMSDRASDMCSNQQDSKPFDTKTGCDRLSADGNASDAQKLATSNSVRASGIPEDKEDQPYATLIYRALKSVPSHQMVLRDIYKWFQEHTKKPQRCSNDKQGWKNSIRHNLSMNLAFEKTEPVDGKEDGKKHSAWRLSDEVEKTGKVHSTTRFRNKKGKGCSYEEPARSRASAVNRVTKRHRIIKREADEAVVALVRAVDGTPETGGAVRSPETETTEHKASMACELYRHSVNGLSFDCGYSYMPFGGINTPSTSTTSTVADSHLPDSPITSTPYSPDLTFDQVDVADFEQISEYPYILSSLDDFNYYRLHSRNMGESGSGSMRREVMLADCNPGGVISSANAFHRSTTEPATCTLAELKLPRLGDDQFDVVGKYETASGNDFDNFL